MTTKGTSYALVIPLIISIVFGAIILVFDGLLWLDNPKNGHAYALIVFTLIQVVLLGSILSRRAWAVRATLYWASIYLAMLALNPLTGPAIGISPAEFALYLFGITPISGDGGLSCPLYCPPLLISYDVLILAQVLIIAAALRSRRV
jgi:hypothetical protein